MDPTKFSRNYRIGSVEGNMIFEGTSYLPKEVMLEMTLKAFGYDIDMMEVNIFSCFHLNYAMQGFFSQLNCVNKNFVTVTDWNGGQRIWANRWSPVRKRWIFPWHCPEDNVLCLWQHATETQWDPAEHAACSEERQNEETGTQTMYTLIRLKTAVINEWSTSPEKKNLVIRHAHHSSGFPEPDEGHWT